MSSSGSRSRRGAPGRAARRRRRTRRPSASGSSPSSARAPATNFHTSNGSPGTSRSQRRTPSGPGDERGAEHVGPPRGDRLLVGGIDHQSGRLAGLRREHAELVRPPGRRARATPSPAGLVQHRGAGGDQRRRPTGRTRSRCTRFFTVLGSGTWLTQVVRSVRLAAQQVTVVVGCGSAVQPERRRPESRRRPTSSVASRQRSFQRARGMAGNATRLWQAGGMSDSSRRTAYGVGLFTMHIPSGDILDVWFPEPRLGLPADDDRPRGHRRPARRRRRPRPRHDPADRAGRDRPRRRARATRCDVWLRLHLLSHRLVRPHEPEHDRRLRQADQRRVDQPRAVRRRRVRAAPGCKLMRRGPVHVLRRRQVPADGRLRAAVRRAHRRRPTGCGSARTSRPARR